MNEQDRFDERIAKASIKGSDVYQEYLVSIIIRHKDSVFAHNLWFKYIATILKAKVFKNLKVKSVQILKGIKRSPEMAAAEDDWLEM